MAVWRACSKLTVLDFRRAYFGLFMDLFKIEPWTAEGHENADWYLRITSYNFRSNASKQGGNWAKMSRGLHG